MRTLEDFQEQPKGIFARGVVEQGPRSGVYFIDKHIGRLMKWVAVKGEANDWSMYFYWDDEYDYERVAQSGDKLSDKVVIQRLLNCSNGVMYLYRK